MTVERQAWPVSGYQMTGLEFTALLKASGHSLRSFARQVGIDGRKFRTKHPIDFSGDAFAVAAIDQMRAEVAHQTQE